MINLLMAFSALTGVQAAAPAAPVATPAAPARALSSIPGVTVQYYDVTGNNGKEVEKSLKAVRRAGPDGNPVPASTSWKADAQIQKRTEGTACKIVSAKMVFSGTAELPRLVSAKPEPAFVPQWQAFMKELEADSAADLGYIYDHIGEIEKAVLAAPCETAGAAMQAATDSLKARVAAIASQRAAAKAEAAKAKAKEKKQRPRLI